MKDFDGMLDAVLRETANPEPSGGFGERLRQSLRAEGVAMNTAAIQGSEGSMWNRLWPVSFRTAAEIRDERGFGPVWGAVMAHGLAVLVLVYVVSAKVGIVIAPKMMQVAKMELLPPLRIPPRMGAIGGGGGQPGVAPASKGALPKTAERPILPPMPRPLEEAKIHLEPTIELQRDLRMVKSDAPNIGLPNSFLAGTSMGNGSGGGLGTGVGDGVGLGFNGNTGGGPYRVGGGVSAPVVLYQPEPEFSEEARKAKVAGDVLVSLWVDETGRVSHLRVIRGIGMGLDEKALAAVQQYRFKPAMKNGKPVTVEMNVDVDFRIY